MSCKQRAWVGFSHCCRLAARTSETQMPSAQSSQNLLGTFMSPHLSLYLLIGSSISVCKRYLTKGQPDHIFSSVVQQPGWHLPLELA